MKKLLAIFCFFCLFVQNGISQQELSILFWNVENLFHPTNDSLTDDDEFTPSGARYWSYNRYRIKCNLIWKTIFLSGNDGPPDIIALCEIENRKVLDDLFRFSPLKNYNYQLIHMDSPDPRGIDVALAYRPEQISLMDTCFISFCVPELNGRMTRDILKASFLWESDSIGIFVNHWPSKYGGAGYTDVLRIRAAELLSSEVRKIQEFNPGRYLICCGDFNDIPESRSLQLLINAENRGKKILQYVKPFPDLSHGSIKYQGNWELIDHFFAGGAFLDSISGSSLKISSSQILQHDFLLKEDEKFGGKQVYRTYSGYRYLGGFSDHLPVLLIIERK